jgi:Domain of unknown function (DUF4221)
LGKTKPDGLGLMVHYSITLFFSSTISMILKNKNRNLARPWLLGSILGLLVLGCSGNGNKRETALVGGQALEFKIDSLAIPIDSTTGNFYSTFHEFTQNGISYLGNYNSFRHSIDFFDLNNAKLAKVLPLQRNGPDQVDSPRSLWVQNWDSIFLFQSRAKLTLLDSQGRVSRNFNLLSGEVGTDMDDLLSDHNFPLQIVAQKQVAYFYNVPSGNMEKTLITPFVAKLSLKTGKASFIPIYYSDFYRERRGKFGNLWNASATVAGGKIIYNFQAESNIYVYDTATQQVRTVKSPSRYSPNQATSEQVEAEAHPVENTLFCQVLPDPYRKLYYRFHWGGIPAVAPDGTVRDMTDKPLLLMVFDQDFNLLDEIKLPPATHRPYTWFVNRSGLWLSAAHPKGKNQSQDLMKLHCFKFDTPAR